MILFNCMILFKCMILFNCIVIVDWENVPIYDNLDQGALEMGTGGGGGGVRAEVAWRGVSVRYK